MPDKVSINGNRNIGLLEIRKTSYGGRGYFALEEIEEGTVVLDCVRPFASVIFKPFRKEVCAFCFDYNDGKPLKFKLSKTKTGGPAYGGLNFCTDQCRQQWEKTHDSDGIMSETLENIEKGVKLLGKSPNVIITEVEVEVDIVESMEELDLIWNEEESRRNSRKTKLSDLPTLDDAENDFARLVACSAIEKYRGTWQVFDELQSNELEQLREFRGLLEAQIKIYRFLQATLPSKVLAVFDSNVLRLTLGREAGNAFGIWEQPMMMESECFGTAVYPEASFFNHWCEPEVKKKRMGGSMKFISAKPINKGSELHISYGMMEELPYKERQRVLKSQWHFACVCPRCVRDAELKN